MQRENVLSVSPGFQLHGRWALLRPEGNERDACRVHVTCTLNSTAQENFRHLSSFWAPANSPWPLHGVQGTEENAEGESAGWNDANFTGWGILLKQFWFRRSGWDPRLGPSNKLPGEAPAAGLGTRVWLPRMKEHQNIAAAASSPGTLCAALGWVHRCSPAGHEVVNELVKGINTTGGQITFKPWLFFGRRLLCSKLKRPRSDYWIELEEKVRILANLKWQNTSCVLDALGKKSSTQTPLNLHCFRLMGIKCQETYLDSACLLLFKGSKCLRVQNPRFFKHRGIVCIWKRKTNT